MFVVHRSQINVFYVIMYVLYVLYGYNITNIRREYVCTEYCKENGPHARRRKVTGGVENGHATDFFFFSLINIIIIIMYLFDIAIGFIY